MPITLSCNGSTWYATQHSAAFVPVETRVSQNGVLASPIA